MTLTARLKTLLFFAVIVSSGWSADAVEIRLKPDAQIRGSIVLLGDVAEVHGDDLETVALLKRTELFPTPSPGRSRALRLREVRELLRLNGFDVADCEFPGVRSTRVSRDTSARSPKKSRNETEDTASFAVVARRALGKGETIRAVDIQLQATEKPLRGVSPLSQLNDAVGLELTHAVAVGQPLDARYLRRPILVHRREMVTVHARAAGVCVKTNARALEDGSLGDLVTLESLENREQYAARVIGPQQVDVFVSGVEVDPTSISRRPIASTRRPKKR